MTNGREGFPNSGNRIEYFLKYIFLAFINRKEKLDKKTEKPLLWTTFGPSLTGTNVIDIHPFASQINHMLEASNVSKSSVRATQGHAQRHKPQMTKHPSLISACCQAHVGKWRLVRQCRRGKYLLSRTQSTALCTLLCLGSHKVFSPGRTKKKKKKRKGQ